MDLLPNASASERRDLRLKAAVAETVAERAGGEVVDAVASAASEVIGSRTKARKLYPTPPIANPVAVTPTTSLANGEKSVLQLWACLLGWVGLALVGWACFGGLNLPAWVIWACLVLGVGLACIDWACLGGLGFSCCALRN